MLVGRPGYWIDTVLSRGALDWALAYQLERAQTFAYLAFHLSWLLFGFCPCVNLEFVFISIPSSSSSKTDFIWISCCVFYVGGFTDLPFLREVKLFSCGFLLTWWTMMFLCILLKGFFFCDSNETKIIEIGVRMKKLLQFSFCCFCQFSENQIFRYF